MSDAEHWLWRLSAAQWIAAARHELAQGHARVGSRRAALVHARRGGGMALNAVLVALGEGVGADERAAIEARWGRSYVEHLQAIADGGPEIRAPLPEEARDAARTMLATPLQAQVIALGRGPGAEASAALEAAQRLLDACLAAIVGSPPQEPVSIVDDMLD